MTRFLLQLLLFTTCLCALWSGRVHADTRDHDDCPQSRIDDAFEPQLAEVVVPCGLVESGALGPDCHDAAFYVVNSMGTLLCRLDVTVLSSSSSSNTIDDREPAAAPHPVGSPQPALPSVFELQWPAVAVVDVLRACGPASLFPADDHVHDDPRPS
jgi:hypothetical protein